MNYYIWVILFFAKLTWERDGVHSANPDFVYQPDADDTTRPCTFRGNQSQGICQRLDLCPGAITDIKRYNVSPTQCGFLGKVPIVCCTEAKSDNPVLRISADRKS